MKDLATYHLPVLLYGALILAVSSIPHLKAPEVSVFANDKILHFLEYAVFAFLALRSTRRRFGSTSLRRAFLLALLALAVFAALDESLQGFVPGRHTDLLDYAADLAGGLTALGLCYWRLRR